MSERKQRTPAEIIAETEAKLSRLLLKQARQDAMGNPAIAPLVAELDQLRVNIREAKKGLGQGPQSFDARVAKHEAWLVRIADERYVAECVLEDCTNQKEVIEEQIAQAVADLVPSTNPNELSANA